MDEVQPHEFSIDPGDRQEYLEAAFEEHPDLASALAATGVAMTATQKAAVSAIEDNRRAALQQAPLQFLKRDKYPRKGSRPSPVSCN